MDSTFLIFYSIMFALLAASLIVLYGYLHRNILNPTGKGAEKKTTRRLKRYASLRRFQVLTNVTIPKASGKGTVTIENMLIGYFGILLVETCGARGEYYGMIDSENWSVILNDKKTVRPNPLRLQQEQMAALRALLSKNRIFKVDISNVVYISAQGKKTTLFITHGGEILRKGKLGKHLEKARFDEDKGVDISAVAAVIEQARVQPQ